jgi:general secretion pathway protein G
MVFHQEDRLFNELGWILRFTRLRTILRMSMKKGFTLIEIMVVIAILGVLVTMISGSFVASQKKSRDLKRKSDLSQIGKSLEFYFNDAGRYPLSSSGNIVGCESLGVESPCTWGSEWKNTTSNMTYMAVLPKDPTNSQTYYYSSDATGSYYRLYARLENSEDGSTGVYTTICSGAAVVCNYGIASPNTNP